MRKMVLIVVAVLFVLTGGAWYYLSIGSQKITNFKECVEAGNPILESYPEQCRTPDGRVFINKSGAEPQISETEARNIAVAGCLKEGGVLANIGSYNGISQTWWFDLMLEDAPQGCNPACMVYEETSQVEINWRCTGLIPNDIDGVACTMDAMLCPDGSYVGRIPPDCEFEPCP